jgi:hypothetical protein
MKSMLMKDYPKEIQEFVKKRSEHYSEKYPLLTQFYFDDQPEGWKFWWEISIGNLDIFYEKYPKNEEDNISPDKMFLDDFIKYFNVTKVKVNDIDVKEPEVLNNDSIVAKVIDSFKERSNVGFKKYGTNLDRKDLSPLEWINHFQQELQDAILYAEKLKEDLPTQSPRVMVIRERDHFDNEEIIIGVASDRENALRIIEEYYGVESTMSNFRDIRDSGLDFTAGIEVPGELGGKYTIWVEDFYINEV